MALAPVCFFITFVRAIPFRKNRIPLVKVTRNIKRNNHAKRSCSNSEAIKTRFYEPCHFLRPFFYLQVKGFPKMPIMCPKVDTLRAHPTPHGHL